MYQNIITNTCFITKRGGNNVLLMKPLMISISNLIIRSKVRKIDIITCFKCYLA